MTWKQPFLDIGYMPDDLLLESHSKSSLLFDKYHPDVNKMKFWKIAISDDGYQKVRTWGWKWHENSHFWRLVACLMISYRNLTQNQVYFSTNTIPISIKWNFEKLLFQLMDISRSELEVENDMKTAISGHWLLAWWSPIGI